MNQTPAQNHTKASDSTLPDGKVRQWYQKPLTKTLFWGFVWAAIFAVLLPLEKMQLWHYSFLVSSVPSTLLWDWFNLQSQAVTMVSALINALIILSPFWYYRISGQQFWWFYSAMSFYAFMNAALGFTIIISVKNIAHL